ncbi:GatB/YqeY domain-containing protein [Mariprofundus sp. EBB-1]|uniref:GatB/YqeY domain-containing protein n=1 Tax=Mariprofundus sp. EBB-1 TaxID=2650971 RepID=UPI000EF28081|nr:GatB/YqeY domain-containing protein [Mariprofundus sp. EBB-1]RLL55035.1 GatB/YqeY domain-containing protein [Mariprofundus sp. EBB-1]
MQKQLINDMKAAMKAGEKSRLSCIRMLRAAMKDKEIELGHALDDAEAMAVVSKLVKQRNDAAKQYADADRSDLQEQELTEAAVFQTYLPEPLSDDELAVIIDQAISDADASSMRDMGKVMGIVKSKAEGRADMGKVSGIIKSRLG